MNQSRITIRYAKALFLLSVEQNLLEESYKDMLLLHSICSESKELLLLLKTPIVKTDKKLKIIHQVFGGKIAKHSMMFINIITKKKREFLLESIASSFITLYKQKNNIETATVTTATKLNDDLKREVITFIEQQGNKKVELKEIINSKIIGGAIIRMGDKQLDTSVSKEISELRKIFNKNLYLQDY